MGTEFGVVLIGLSSEIIDVFAHCRQELGVQDLAFLNVFTLYVPLIAGERHFGVDNHVLLFGQANDGVRPLDAAFVAS